MVIKMKLRKPVVLLLLFTVLAPIVLYTDRLGTFKSSSSRDEFIEDVSTFTLGGDVRPLNLLPQEPSKNLKEPLGMVYLENSSRLSLSDSNASTGENSRKTRQLTEESAEHLNTVSTTTNGTEDRHPEEKNPIRQVTEQGHKPGLTDQNENREQENVKDKMGKVGVSEDTSTSTSTSNNASVHGRSAAAAKAASSEKTAVRIAMHIAVGGSFHEEVNASKRCITPSTKWEQVKEILGDSGRAAIQTQGSTSNPFGSTFVYGYQNVAFEGKI